MKKIIWLNSYTSRLIQLCTFNGDIAIVDTNISRILISEGCVSEFTNEKELFVIATALFPLGRSRDWHNTFMVYGTIMKTYKTIRVKPLSIKRISRGSNRQYRENNVKYLTDYDHSTVEKLIQVCIAPRDKVEGVVESLIKDKLMMRQNNRYSLSWFAN